MSVGDRRYTAKEAKELDDTFARIKARIEELEQQLAAEREACEVIANSYGHTETEMAIRARGKP